MCATTCVYLCAQRCVYAHTYNNRLLGPFMQKYAWTMLTVYIHTHTHIYIWCVYAHAYNNRLPGPFMQKYAWTMLTVCVCVCVCVYIYIYTHNTHTFIHTHNHILTYKKTHAYNLLLDYIPTIVDFLFHSCRYGRYTIPYMCMCMYVWMFVCVYMYVCIQSRMGGIGPLYAWRVCMHTCIVYVCMYIITYGYGRHRSPTCVYACMHACMYTHTKLHMHIRDPMHANIYMCVCVCVCVCVHTYI
jgi:hypothetical protein